MSKLASKKYYDKNREKILLRNREKAKLSNFESQKNYQKKNVKYVTLYKIAHKKGFKVSIKELKENKQLFNKIKNLVKTNRNAQIITRKDYNREYFQKNKHKIYEQRKKQKNLKK